MHRCRQGGRHSTAGGGNNPTETEAGSLVTALLQAARVRDRVHVYLGGDVRGERSAAARDGYASV